MICKKTFGMTSTIIIAICLLLLVAYIFDISSSKTKIPSVIFLLTMGWFGQQIIAHFQFELPDLRPFLPLLGTVGLILIVLEGSLELELKNSTISMIRKSVVVALLPILLFAAIFAYIIHYVGNVSYFIGLANALPLAIISSSIAIPSAQNLQSPDKQFITYESSLSDIFGVILFNFVTLNDNFGASALWTFLFDILIMLVISFIATIMLAFLLGKINHHVKFLPIILMIVLIYEIAKIYHLPALIFILLFGIFLSNLDELIRFKIIQKLEPSILNKEVHKFKDLTSEIAFLVRALFFILFGYLINTQELLNMETIVWSVSICAGIFALRYIILKTFSVHIRPLLFIAPRGLITILLFLNIPLHQSTILINNSLIIQVVILTSFIMMIGLMTDKKKEAEPSIEVIGDH